MTRHYFGTDGIRARFGSEKMNPDFVFRFGFAVAKTLLTDKNNQVFIGRDTRESGPILEASLRAGLEAAGANVTLLGVIPTPVVAYLTRMQHATCGIVISASHNPYYDNGIKLFNEQGMKLTDAEELEIEAQLSKSTLKAPTVIPQKNQEASLMTRSYLDFCKSLVPSNVSLAHLTLVIDAANGAAFEIAPILFRELGAHVIEIGCAPNGTNINDACGVMDMAALKKEVLLQGADLGIAFDGDADRLQLVDDKGEFVDGDEILAILAKAHASKGVVGTLMTNLGLEQALAKWGVDFERSKVGDRYVLQTLLEKGWSLGGEASGHIIDLNYTTTGDGILTALQVLIALTHQEKTLHELKNLMTKRPQVLKNVRMPEGMNVIDHPKTRLAVATASSKLEGRGRVLLRLSGTEPLVRVMAEGEDALEVSSAVDDIASVIATLSDA